jgi:hypothetical protein
MCETDLQEFEPDMLSPESQHINYKAILLETSRHLGRPEINVITGKNGGLSRRF